MDSSISRDGSPSALDAPLPDPILVVCAADTAQPPLYSFQVNFPRLELVLAGTYRNGLCDRHGDLLERTLTAGQCLLIPANCWNKPTWDDDVTVLSLLFGKRQLGLSRTSWSAAQQTFGAVVKQSHPLSANSPVHLMLQALVQLRGDEAARPACLLAQAVIAFARDILAQPLSPETSWPRRLFENICIYLQENFHKAISRESVAARFNISANYLSRLFQQQGDIGFAEYLIFVRLERAKFLLRRYPFPLEEVSHRCGFRDVKYFCRLFKSRFGQTPTEYRRDGLSERA
jgi:AraC-like DNA-binding protein